MIQKRLLLVGGEGFIGSYLAAKFMAQGFKVAVMDNYSNSTPNEQNYAQGMKVYPNDICYKTEVDMVFNDFLPHYVFHLAAQTNAPGSFRNPTDDAWTNILGTIHIIEASHLYGIQHLIYSSSGGAVYGETNPWGADELSTPFPATPYGLSKLASEAYFPMLLRNSSTRYDILRYSNVYGPGQGERGEGGVISIFANRLELGLPLKVYGKDTNADRGCIRDYVYVDDIYQAHRLLLETPVHETRVLNVSSGDDLPTLDLAQRMGKVWGTEPIIYMDPPRKGDVGTSIITNGLIHKVLPGYIATPLDLGLKLYRDSRFTTK